MFAVSKTAPPEQKVVEPEAVMLADGAEFTVTKIPDDVELPQVLEIVQL